MEEEIRKILNDHERRISELEGLVGQTPSSNLKKISEKEFILAKEPRDDVQKTLLIGYYLEKYRGLMSFNIKDLEDGFRAAKERVPENINYKVIKNIRHGFMMESDQKKNNLKAWNLTNAGEKHVEANLEDKT